MKHCPFCNSIVKGHPNKKFCNTSCKDRYHNHTNPRGYFAHLHPCNHDVGLDAMEDGWDGHKVWTGSDPSSN